MELGTPPPPTVKHLACYKILLDTLESETRIKCVRGEKLLWRVLGINAEVTEE
jgi:hypothetical protein